MTETGKGDRWEGDRQGRSEPAFQVPAPPHSHHQPALHGERPADVCWLLFCCEACIGRIVGSCYYKACAGRIIRRLCLPATALFCGLCVPARLCHAMPTAFIVHAPFILLCPPCSFHVRQDRKQQFASCKNCPVGSYNAGLQWWPAHRVASKPPSTVPFAPARRLHLCSPCAVVRCGHVKRGRPRTACEQPAKFPTPAF